MTHTITVQALAQRARLLAQTYPDRVAVCSYTRYEGDRLVPNCIVGTAAYELGITLEQLYSVNTCGIRHLAGFALPEWLDISADNTEPIVDWLSALQQHQDSRNTWGAALRVADRRIVLTHFNI